MTTGYVDYPYDTKDYYAGDLALSFDGNSSTYEFGVDFGFFTKNYDNTPNSGGSYDPVIVDMGTGTGIDNAGIYSGVTWDNGVYQGHTASNPFALDTGTEITTAGFSQSSGSGSVGGETSYYQIVSFDLAALGLDLSNPLDMDTHWTMSCGNDAIDGSQQLVAVPEP